MRRTFRYYFLILHKLLYSAFLQSFHVVNLLSTIYLTSVLFYLPTPFQLMSNTKGKGVNVNHVNITSFFRPTTVSSCKNLPPPTSSSSVSTNQPSSPIPSTPSLTSASCHSDLSSIRPLASNFCTRGNLVILHSVRPFSRFQKSIRNPIIPNYLYVTF